MSENRATDEKCEQLLSHVFGQLEDLQSRIAPEGWEKSPYVRVHHPSPEQIYEESVQMHENLNSLFRNKDEPNPPPMIVQAYRTVYGKWPQGWVQV